MKKVNNVLDFNSVYSDLVYPDWTNDKAYEIICVVDKDWLRFKLMTMFNKRDLYINNKYAISFRDDLLLYQHDHKTYLLKQL
jgi:hypothetical protein